MVAADGAQVRNGVIPTRVYLEAQMRDSVDRPIVIETNIPPPASKDGQVSANATAYSIWSIEIMGKDTFKGYTVGAEVDGVKGTRNGLHSLFDFSQCP